MSLHDKVTSHKTPSWPTKAIPPHRFEEENDHVRKILLAKNYEKPWDCRQHLDLIGTSNHSQQKDQSYNSHKEMNSAKAERVWKLIFPWSNFQKRIQSRLYSVRPWAWYPAKLCPRLPSHWCSKLINVCRFKSLSFRVICFTAVEINIIDNQKYVLLLDNRLSLNYHWKLYGHIHATLWIIFHGRTNNGDVKALNC